MDNIKKIQVNGITYSIYDGHAHQLLNESSKKIPIDLVETESGSIGLVNEDSSPIGTGIPTFIRADGFVLKQDGDSNQLFLAYQGQPIGKGIALPGANSASGEAGTGITSIEIELVDI